MKTSELTGAALDWAVAKCEGYDMEYFQVVDAYSPSTDYAQGGPIIEREKILLDFYPDGCHKHGGEWLAHMWDENGSPTAEEMDASLLIAAMRVFVASKLGDEVEIPN